MGSGSGTEISIAILPSQGLLPFLSSFYLFLKFFFLFKFLNVDDF